MMKDRSSGILCHITSLPSPYGIGDLGPQAYRFVDRLAGAGQRWWQVLPLNPVDSALGNSPYSSFSSFAFNTLFLSPELLVKEGFLKKDIVDRYVSSSEDRVDYAHAAAVKEAMVVLAYEAYRERRFPLKAFERFCLDQSSWLDDHAAFVVLKRLFANVCWSEWPVEYRDRHPAALEDIHVQRSYDIEKEKFAQYLFYRQWMDLQGYCSAKGVGLIGDIPIYVNYDSTDVWVHPDLFKLDAYKKPTFVAGVPPDYFSKEGQRWGNPVYDWEALRATGFAWWIDRLRHQLTLFDAVRIDHFRAFAQCWEIPAEEATAVRGAWKDVPGVELFTALKDNFARLPIIAEDLGIITRDVDALKERFGFPGMRVIMFAFHNDYLKSRDLPENYVPLSVVYTGTHDNNTIQGWFANDMTPVEKKNMTAYLGALPDVKDINGVMIRLAMMSRSSLCVIPVQDILGAGGEARMNKPSTVQGNWSWRFRQGALSRDIVVKMRRLTENSLRCGVASAPVETL